MSFIDNIKLFDPFNPNDATKFSKTPSPRDSKLDRFQQMRETAGSTRQDTIGFGERWEERICQLSSNAAKLFKLNPYIKISKNCIRRSGNWIAQTPQTADLIISNGNYNEEFKGKKYSKQTFKESIISGEGFGSTETQYKNLSKIIELLDKDKKVIKYGSISKKGMLGSAGDTLGSEVRIIKIITPDPHFTMALYYPEENRVEYWDPGGSWGSVEYNSDGNPFSATLKRRKQTRSKYGECLGDNEEGINKNDLVICRSFKHLLPDVDFVSMNTRDLQISDADAYCQTWVLLYTYMRFIYPIMTTMECVEFFKSLDEKKLLELIEKWAEYLIYFNADNEINNGFKLKYKKYTIYKSKLSSILNTPSNKVQLSKKKKKSQPPLSINNSKTNSKKSKRKRSN